MDIDCGDNSCRFATNRERGAMRTNGGCRCFEKAGFGPSAVSAALQMLPEITHLRAEVEKLRRVRDAVVAYFAAQADCHNSREAWGRLFETQEELRAALDAVKDEQ